MARMDEVIKILPHNLAKEFTGVLKEKKNVEEIRLRINQPVFVFSEGQEYYLTKRGDLESTKIFDEKKARIVINEELIETINYISKYSRYAYEEEMRQGFFTIKGGHRIGIGGRVILDEGKVRSFKQITFLTIRIAHEIKGCAKFLLPYLYEKNRLLPTLIASGPGNGKTTLLRDLIRLLSNGSEEHSGLNVGVVDERCELAACELGIPQNDLGLRTDILDGCPKIWGLRMLLRSMNPAVIAVDELGTIGDKQALLEISGCGCVLIATAHIEAGSAKFLHTFLEGNSQFKRIVMLGRRKKEGQVVQIYDEKGDLLENILRKEGESENY